MKNIILIILAASVFSAESRSQDICAITHDRLEGDLGLDFHSFDQTPGNGHREFASRGCYLSAAKITDIYHLHHQLDLLPWQSRILAFHAGQMYAFDQLYDIAINRFKRSFNPEESPTAELSWNAYVKATIAFLAKDMAELRVNRRSIALKPTDGNIINLRVVDAFIRCFDKPYHEAYSDICME